MKNLLTTILVIILLGFGSAGVYASWTVDPFEGGGDTTTTRFTPLKNILWGTSIVRINKVDKGRRNFYINDPSKPPGTTKKISFAGTFEGTLDGTSTYFYCVDLFHPLAFYPASGEYTDDASTNSYITYITNHYYPFVNSGSADKNLEAAAVQIAIWHFSDGVDATSTTVADVRDRAIEIIVDAEQNHLNSTIVPTLSIDPAEQAVFSGTEGAFYVRAVDQNNNPVSGITVNLTVQTSATLSTYSVTITNGVSPLVTITQGSDIVDFVTATAQVYMPVGMRYVHTTLPAGKQKIVLAAPALATRSVNVSISWYDQQVEPILECVRTNGDGTFTAMFGYYNPNDFPIALPVGFNNNFTGEGMSDDMGQATVFEPGRSGNFPNPAFEVQFNGGEITWHLNGASVTASQYSLLCSEHVFINKQWIDLDGNILDGPPENLSADYRINVQSMYGTATGQYVDGQFVVEYLNSLPGPDKNPEMIIEGLLVPIGTTYSVEEVNVPNNFIPLSGVGSFVSVISGGPTDMAVNPYAPFEGGEEIANYGLHTVSNQERFLGAKLGDRVWHDWNKDGIQDGDEPGVEGIPVVLYNCSDVLIAETATDADGYYLFENLEAGDYYVAFDISGLENYFYTIRNAGDNPNFDSDVDPVTGNTKPCLTLEQDQTDLSWDAGIYFDDSANLRIEKTADKTDAEDGDIVTFTVTVCNDGPAAATNVSVSDVLPIGLDFQSYTVSQGVLYGEGTSPNKVIPMGIYTWDVGALESGTCAVMTITTEVNADKLSSVPLNLGPASPYNLFVFDNMVCPSSDVQGKLAVGGDLYLSSYSVGDQYPNTNGAEDILIVGDNLIFTSGRVYSGNVVYGVSTNLPVLPVGITEGTLRQDNVIDFDQAQMYLSGLSIQLSGIGANAVDSVAGSRMFLKGNNPYVNVFEVSGQELSQMTEVLFSIPSGAVALLNIDGVEPEWHGGLAMGGTSINNVLYNFFEAETLHISNIEIHGSILAPFAHLDFPTGLVKGQVVCKSMEGTGQFNLHYFTGHIPVDTVVTNIAEIWYVDQPDPNSTPGNGIIGEDDDASASVHVTNIGNYGGGTGSTNTWEVIGEVSPGQIVWTMANTNDGRAVSGMWGGDIFISNTEKTEWTLINPDMQAGFIWSVLVDAQGAIYAATERGIYRSSFDSVAQTFSWSVIGLENKDVRTIFLSRNGYLYAGVWGEGVFRSFDAGSNWLPLNNGLNSLAVQTLTETLDQQLFVGTFGDPGVSKWDPTSASWVPCNVGYPWIWSLAARQDGALFAGSYGSGMYTSSDGGDTWVLDNLPGSHIYSIFVDTLGFVYANTWANGMFLLSPEKSNEWMTLGLGGVDVSSVIVDRLNTSVYAGTADGRILRNVTPTAIDDHTNDVKPVTYSLSQNYPNPFNPVTTIQYAIPQSGFVTLKVYNILGEEVATLVDKEQFTGTYSVSFDAHALASGVYFYRLTSGSYTNVQKMLLLK